MTIHGARMPSRRTEPTPETTRNSLRANHFHGAEMALERRIRSQGTL